ncbi:MAG: hypothetical protein Q9215_003188 [Flavoplaca cf. flavocitrina]
MRPVNSLSSIKEKVSGLQMTDKMHTSRRKTTHEEGSGTVSAVSNTQVKPLPSEQAPEQAWKAGRKEWMIIIVLAIVSLMVALDATILVPALPAIASDLHGNTTDTFWTGTAYLLTQSVLQPFLVSLSDVFGRRLLYLVSLAFFTVGTLLCCLARNFHELLAGRSIQGVGGGGILALGLVILTDIVPLRQRPIYLGVNQMSWALGSMFCELYYIPFYFESVKDYSPTITGLALLPLTGAMLPTSVVIGRLMSRFGCYRWAIWLGWVTAITGTGLLILLGVDTRVFTWVVIFLVVGLGHGLILMSLNFSVQAMADTQNVAYAAAMYTFTRTFGMCVGVAAGGTVFQNELKKQLDDLQLPTAVAKDAEKFVTTLKVLPKDSGEYQHYILAYAESFKVVFVVLTALTGLAGLLSLLIKEHTMDRVLDSEHTLRQRQHPNKPETTITNNNIESNSIN